MTSGCVRKLACGLQAQGHDFLAACELTKNTQGVATWQH